MNLKFHDEKSAGCWGGIFEAEGKMPEVAALWEHPQAERLAHLFCAAEQMETVIRAGVEMRAAQKAYFAKRTSENLIASKVAESAFDKAAKAVLAKLEVAP